MEPSIVPTLSDYIAALRAIDNDGDDTEMRRCILDAAPASVRHRMEQYLHSHLKRPKFATTDRLADALTFYRSQLTRHTSRGEAVATREAFTATKARFNLGDRTLDRLIEGATKHVNDEITRRRRRDIS